MCILAVILYYFIGVTFFLRLSEEKGNTFNRNSSVDWLFVTSTWPVIAVIKLWEVIWKVAKP